MIRRAFSFTIPLALTLVAGILALPSAASAQQTWDVQVGTESQNEAKQADAFLPNEIWIYAGDSIQFKFGPKHEVHTVTFLQDGQVRPLFSGPPTAPVGCDKIGTESAAQSSGTEYGGTGATSPALPCVNSGPMADGATYTVKFPTAGNYKMVCLVHADMNGVVHVMQNTDSHAPFYAASLPYEQFDYKSSSARRGQRPVDRQ